MIWWQKCSEWIVNQVELKTRSRSSIPKLIEDVQALYTPLKDSWASLKVNILGWVTWKRGNNLSNLKNCNYGCVFRTPFGCCAHPKAGWNIFFQPFFNLYCSFQSFFSDFTAEITKNVWKWTKKRVFVYSSKLVDMQKLVDSLRGYLKIVFFSWFFTFLTFFDWFRCLFVDL